MFRNLQALESLHQAEGTDLICGPDGTEYSILDIRALYESRLQVLTPARATAIEMHLYHDMRESDAAAAMGLSRSSPVAIYASQGLRQLIAFHEGGEDDLPAAVDEAA